MKIFISWKVKRPAIEGTAGFSYGVIEKYDASRKFNWDENDDEDTKNLKQRLETLEKRTKDMEEKYAKLIESYLRMRRLLIEHKDKLQAETNISEILEELHQMGLLLGQYADDIDLKLPQGMGS